MLEDEDNPLDQARFVEVYRAKNLAQAKMLQDLLEEKEIPVMLEGEMLQGVAGEVPMGWATLPRLLVEERQVDQAREILSQAEQGEMQRAGAGKVEKHGETENEDVCLSCGEPLGIRESQCPACGWSYGAGVED